MGQPKKLGSFVTEDYQEKFVFTQYFLMLNNIES